MLLVVYMFQLNACTTFASIEHLPDLTKEDVDDKSPEEQEQIV